MSQLVFLAFLIAVVSAKEFLGKCGESATDMTDIFTPGARIVNGKFIEPGSWPWIAALVRYKPALRGKPMTLFQFCGSTLIHPQWIVTAAHCVDSASQAEMQRTNKIMIGNRDLLDSTTVLGLASLLNISKVILHEQYDKPFKSINNDIALIKLEKPIAAHDLKISTIYPACLPEKHINQTNLPDFLESVKTGRKVLFVAGWGHTQQGGGHAAGEAASTIGAGSDTAKQTDIEMYHWNECKQKMSAQGYYFSEQMVNSTVGLLNSMNCGGFDDGASDACQADSGGPLIQYNDDIDRYELAGIVSWGAGCAVAGKPGIYTNVRGMRDWILDTIRKN